MLYADMSIFEFLDYVADTAKKHDAQQTTIVDSFKEPPTLSQYAPRATTLNKHAPVTSNLILASE